MRLSTGGWRPGGADVVKSEFVQTRHLQALAQPLSAPGDSVVCGARPVSLGAGTSRALHRPPGRIRSLDAFAGVEAGGTLWIGVGGAGADEGCADPARHGISEEWRRVRKRFELLQFSGTNAAWVFRLRPRSPQPVGCCALSLEVRTNDLALVASELSSA